MKTLKIQGYDKLFDNKELLLSKKGQNILKETRNHSLLFQCLCQGKENPLGMHVRRIKTQDKYYYTIIRNKNTMDKHKKDCHNYSTPEYKQKYENSTGTTYAPVESFIDENMYIIAENILYDAWCKYLHINKELPRIENLFKMIYNSNFTINHNNIKISINDIIFKPFGKIRNKNIDQTIKKAYYQLHTKEHQMYLLVKIESISPHEDNQKSILKVTELQKKNYFHLIIEDKQFRDNSKKLPTIENRLISTTLKDDGEKYLTIDKFFIIPSTDRGIVITSKEEEEFITHLDKSKILYKKPPRTINRYDKKLNKDFNPLFILYDRKKMKEATIAEIYGYNESMDKNKNFVKLYWEKTWKRIDYFKNLTNYNYFYWLYHKNPLPEIYQPKTK